MTSARADGAPPDAMQTLIVQSYRTHDVAPWIGQCLHSVRAWSAQCGYRYEFVDDALFDFAPEWVRQKCGAQRLPVTDVARLYLLRERLGQGWQRVVWIDADVLVFAPDQFALDLSAPYALCSELWVRAFAGKPVEFVEKVNNAVLQVACGQPMLEFWIFAIEEILRVHAPQEIGPLTAGTLFFTDLAKAMPLRVLHNIGLFSAPLLLELAEGGGALTDEWARRFGHPIAAANLCASLQDHDSHDLRIDTSVMQRVVDALLRSRGDIVNRRNHATGASPAFAATPR